eukprot:PhF_6_TR13198/c0_g1_i2/m.20846
MFSTIPRVDHVLSFTFQHSKEFSLRRDYLEGVVTGTCTEASWMHAPKEDVPVEDLCRSLSDTAVTMTLGGSVSVQQIDLQRVDTLVKDLTDEVVGAYGIELAGVKEILQTPYCVQILAWQRLQSILSRFDDSQNSAAKDATSLLERSVSRTQPLPLSTPTNKKGSVLMSSSIQTEIALPAAYRKKRDREEDYNISVQEHEEKRRTTPKPVSPPKYAFLVDHASHRVVHEITLGMVMLGKHHPDLELYGEDSSKTSFCDLSSVTQSVQSLADLHAALVWSKNRFVIVRYSKNDISVNGVVVKLNRPTVVPNQGRITINDIEMRLCY